jgi:glutathione peroxidase
MKTLTAGLLGLAAALAVSCSKNNEVAPTVAPLAAAQVTTVDPSSVYQFTATDINGRRVELGRYRGRKLLIVNTASQCQYTPQYTDLQSLYAAYGRQVVVLAFPSNDFGGQEPGSDGQISSFCANYHLTFPLFSKVAVVGSSAIPLYQFLGDRARNGFSNDRPDWNFCKYLIDESGHVMGFYRSPVGPLSPVLLADINRYPSFAVPQK